MEQYKSKKDAVAVITPANSTRQSKMATETRIKNLEESLRAQQNTMEKYRRELGRLKGHIDDLQHRLNNGKA